MPAIPPGITFLFSLLVSRFGTPTIVVLFGRSLLSRYYHVELPAWSVTPFVGLWVGVSVTYRHWAESARQQKECEEMGAVPFVRSPPRLPGGINALQVVRESIRWGYPGDFLVNIMKKYGPTFVLTSFFEKRIFTADADFIKTILATDFNGYEKGPAQKRIFQTVLGDGVFNADGDMWKFHRSMTRPFFSKERITHFEMFGRHADDAIEQMRSRLRAGHPVDFEDLVHRFTLDSATEFLFGNCVHSLKAGLPYSPNSLPKPGETSNPSDPNNHAHPANIFSEAFSEVQLIIAKRAPIDAAWALGEFWRDETTERMNIIAKFVDPILAEAISKRKAGSAKKGAEKTDEIEEDITLLDQLVRATDDAKMLKDEILNIMIAGRDTTAALLTFAIYLLSQHPDVLQRLRQEILAQIGSSRHPNYDDIREMKYLRAVINETLRLFPAVPFNSRVARKSTTLPNKTPGGKPYYIPAGVKIMYSVFLMQRRTELWGPDAEQFDPDRFLDERVQKYITPNPFIFLPFNAGPRICPGQQFAYNEASYMIIRVLQKFDEISLVPEAIPHDARPPAAWAEAEPGTRKSFEKIWPTSHLTIYVKGGLWVRMREASEVADA